MCPVSSGIVTIMNLVESKNGKAEQYVVKADGINFIVIHISVSNRCILAVVAFILYSEPSSYYMELSWH